MTGREAGAADLPAGLGDVLAALRLGQMMVAEVPTAAGHRSWVAVRPVQEPLDAAAERQGWRRSSTERRFVVHHREYLVEHLHGNDDDIGMRDIDAAEVADETALRRLLAAWGVDLQNLDYPWRSDFPE